MQLVLRCYTARYSARQFRKKFSRFSRDFLSAFSFTKGNVFSQHTHSKKHYINYSKKNIVNLQDEKKTLFFKPILILLFFYSYTVSRTRWGLPSKIIKAELESKGFRTIIGKDYVLYIDN